MVEIVVQAAALRTLEGTGDDDLGHGGDVAEFEQVGGDPEVPVVLPDFVLEIAESLLGAAEALVGANDPDVVPHGAADLVPVVRDDDHLVGVGGLAWLPAGEGTGVAGGRFGEKAVGGAMGADEGFEKGIGGEAIGPVQAGAGHLTDGIQTGDFGLAVEVGDDAAALVVGRGNDRDRFLGDVEAVLQAAAVDVREVVDDESGRLVGDVEEHAIGAGAFHLGVDGTGHDVAGSEFGPRVIAVHEALAVGTQQQPAFTADRFRDEEGFGLGMEKAGGMELDELHVRNRGSGAVGHGHPVARGDVRVGRVEVHLSTTTGGEDDRRCSIGFDRLRGPVEDVHPHATVGSGNAHLAGGYEIDREMILEDVDVGFGGDGLEEGPFDLGAGGVLGVQDAPAGMPAFPREVETPSIGVGRVGILVETGAQFDEFGDPGGAFLKDGADDVLAAEAGAGVEGVPDVEFDGVVGSPDRSNAALGPVGVGVGAVLLGDDGHGAVAGGTEGKGQSGDAGAKDEEVEGARGGGMGHRLSGWPQWEWGFPVPQRPQELGVPEQDAPASAPGLPPATDAAKVENFLERCWDPHLGQEVPVQLDERTRISESEPQASQWNS